MRQLIAISVFLLIPGAVMAFDTPDEQASALFEADWHWRLQNQPEYATQLGDYRFDATLADVSPSAVRAALVHQRKTLERARQLERDKLTPANQLSLDVFVHDKELLLRGAAFFPFHEPPLTGTRGLHIALPQLAAMMPFATEADYRNYLTRLDAVPVHVNGLIEQLRETMRAGWTTPKSAVRGVPAMLRQLREGAVDGALGQPFRQIPATIDKPVRDALAITAAAVLTTKVAPALLQLEEFMRNEYLPAARESIAASALPGGADYYAFLVARQAGQAMTPDDVHALGRKEVGRVLALMPKAIARTGFKGSFARFTAFATHDDRLFYKAPALALTRYRRIVARATDATPRLFDIPALPELLVKPASPLPAGEQGAAWYEGAGGDRPAAVVINTARLNAHPLWGMETLALHEAVPGHHLQVATTRALADLPAFRRHVWYPAYGEGWATYAETLGADLGFYKEPLSAFGHLNADLFRAVRMVVDTGIHARGWTRQQAIDYMNANTANPKSDNAIEVDRMIAQPAQALGYKLGEVKIRALRTRAQRALGASFDVRAFHTAILGHGALPLPLLEQQVELWLAAAKGETAALPVAK